jgi:DNA-binding transcriptional LysR family regulator
VDAKILPDLLVLLEVVRSGSITRAAQRLNTVQSNVTARIAKLEQALAKRHARGVKPTPAGEAAVQLAQRLGAVLMICASRSPAPPRP